MAVKRLKVDAEESAHRELRIASQLAGESTSHIVPIFDSGEDADTGYVFCRHGPGGVEPTGRFGKRKDLFARRKSG